MNSQDQNQQGQERNHAFNKVANYLHQKGYKGPTFTEGHPLALLAGEPIHARSDTTGETDLPRDHEVATHNLQYAKLGFHVIQGTGFLSIRHPGHNPVPLSQVLPYTLDPALGTMVATAAGVILYKRDDGSLVMVTQSPITHMTTEQAQGLADILQANA